MRHNADWQLHNYPSLLGKNWRQARWSAVPRDFTEVRHCTRICGDGWFMQVSAGQQEPHTTLRGLCPLKTSCSLAEGSDKADRIGDALPTPILCSP